MNDYYTVTRGTVKPSGQLSRDDQFRRVRESRLGYAAPSKDWENAGEVIISVFDGQEDTMEGRIRTVTELGINRVYNYQLNKVMFNFNGETNDA